MLIVMTYTLPPFSNFTNHFRYNTKANTRQKRLRYGIDTGTDFNFTSVSSRQDQNTSSYTHCTYVKSHQKHPM